MAILKGKAYWAKLDRASNMFDTNKPRWSIDLALDKKSVNEVTEKGIPIKNKGDERGDFVLVVVFFARHRAPVGRKCGATSCWRG